MDVESNQDNKAQGACCRTACTFLIVPYNILHRLVLILCCMDHGVFAWIWCSDLNYTILVIELEQTNFAVFLLIDGAKLALLNF